MWVAKVFLVLFVIVVLAQGETENDCRANGIDLCAVLRSLETLEVEISLPGLITELQNIIGGVVSTMLCSSGLSVCLPICNIAQALLNVDLELDLINTIFVNATGEPPECNF